MKKSHILFLAASLSLAAVSCRRHPGKHTIIETSTNNGTIQVEYSGRIIFSEDKKGISQMSPDSYFLYKSNYDKFTADCDNKGHITYRFNGDQISTLNDEAKQLISAAVVEIERTKKRG